MSESLDILVVEDESIISEMIKVMLEDMGHKVIGIAHTKRKALEHIKRGGIDLAVVDINLEGGIEGIELSEELKRERIPFMFLTSYADRATLDQAKKTIPGAYVLKPFTEEELFTGLEMTIMHSGKVQENTVNIKDGHRSQILDPEEITYIKADNIYIEIYTSDKKVVSRQTLSAALEKLPEDIFIRVHRSYAVNRKKISSISRSSLQIGSLTIPISRSYRDELRRVMDVN